MRAGKNTGTCPLSIADLTAWYEPEVPVLSGLSLELQDHEIVGLIGLNGAGKTTLIRILSGLHDGYTMKGKKKRQDPFRDPEFKRSRYTVFAEDASFSYFTLREYLNYAAAAYGKELPEVSGLAEGFRFTPYMDVLMGELSMGNRKKAFLMAAFALRPRLLLMDEPVNGLDFESTEYLYEQIASYWKYGTILFSSHVLESITLTCDRVLVLEQGRIRRHFSGAEMRNADVIREALNGGKKESDGEDQTRTGRTE